MNADITTEVRRGEAGVRCSKCLVECNETNPALGINEPYSLS